MVKTMAEEECKTLRDLYPHFLDGELFEAQDRIDRYIRLAVDIFERLRNEPGYPGNMRALTTDTWGTLRLMTKGRAK